jgi:hypothetical protein
LQIDLESLQRHYASLSDEELQALDRDELVEMAQACYDQELAQRKLTSGEDGDTPDWLEDAGCACTFYSQPGSQTAPDTSGDACSALDAAGIPCYLAMHKIDPPSVAPQTRYEYRLMVPGNLNMQAASVLDKEIFNSEVEAEWKVFFESLSDEELRAVDTEELFGGLRDRIERAARAYQEELKARGVASD